MEFMVVLDTKETNINNKLTKEIWLISLDY